MPNVKKKKKKKKRNKVHTLLDVLDFIWPETLDLPTHGHHGSIATHLIIVEEHSVNRGVRAESITQNQAQKPTFVISAPLYPSVLVANFSRSTSSARSTPLKLILKSSTLSDASGSGMSSFSGF
jgi:hypothetical protein